MQFYYECLPCLVRQAIDAVKMCTDNEVCQEKLIKEIIRDIASFNYQETAPVMARTIHNKIKKSLKIDDPYLEIKEKFNNTALKLYHNLEELIDNSKDPLDTAVRIAIAGNVIDFGVYSDVTSDIVEETIEDCLKRKIKFSQVAELKEKIDKASKILYLGDNTGEIVFDKLLIKKMPLKKVTYVVKKEPILNDSTMEDAIKVGMTEIVKVIDNGSNVPGTDLRLCSKEFHKEFESADLIISKGQGNYETLSDIKNKQIYFLLKAKCTVISKDLECDLGDIVIKRAKGFNPEK